MPNCHLNDELEGKEIMTENIGRPPFYKTKEELQAAIDDYFAKTPEEETTITGLALALGFTSRQALLNYQDREEFFDTIKRAKLRVENSYEKDLKKKGNSGTIFALKNFDWKDRTEQDVTSGGEAIGLINVPARMSRDAWEKSTE